MNPVLAASFNSLDALQQKQHGSHASLIIMSWEGLELPSFWASCVDRLVLKAQALREQRGIKKREARARPPDESKTGLKSPLILHLKVLFASCVASEGGLTNRLLAWCLPPHDPRLARLYESAAGPGA